MWASAGGCWVPGRSGGIAAAEAVDMMKAVIEGVMPCKYRSALSGGFASWRVSFILDFEEKNFVFSVSIIIPRYLAYLLVTVNRSRSCSQGNRPVQASGALPAAAE